MCTHTCTFENVCSMLSQKMCYTCCQSTCFRFLHNVCCTQYYTLCNTWFLKTCVTLIKIPENTCCENVCCENVCCENVCCEKLLKTCVAKTCVLGVCCEEAHIENVCCENVCNTRFEKPTCATHVYKHVLRMTLPLWCLMPAELNCAPRFRSLCMGHGWGLVEGILREEWSILLPFFLPPLRLSPP